jgi:hypothetical protein
LDGALSLVDRNQALNSNLRNVIQIEMCLGSGPIDRLLGELPDVPGAPSHLPFFLRPYDSLTVLVKGFYHRSRALSCRESGTNVERIADDRQNSIGMSILASCV